MMSDERGPVMIPSWMIEEVERLRQERERRERPALRIELPVRTDEERPPSRPSPSAIVIETWTTGDAHL